MDDNSQNEGHGALPRSAERLYESQVEAIELEIPARIHLAFRLGQIHRAGRSYLEDQLRLGTSAKMNAAQDGQDFPSS